MAAKRTLNELQSEIDQLTFTLQGDLSAAEHTLRRKRRTAAQRELDRRLKESAQQDRINDLNGEVERLKGCMREWRNARDRAAENGKALRETILCGQDALDKMTKERDTLRSRAATLDGMLQSANAQIKELKLRPSGESDRIRALEMKLEAKAAANKALKKERDDLQDRARVLQEGYAEQSIRISEEARLSRAQGDKLTFWRQMFVAVCLVTVGLAAALASSGWVTLP